MIFSANVPSRAPLRGVFEGNGHMWINFRFCYEREKRFVAGCYTFSVVEYVKLGRKLGIGTRVAAKVLRDRTRNAPSNAGAVRAKASAATAAQRKQVVERIQAAKRVDPRARARNATRGVVRGSRGFGQGFWKPFARVARALWHEITGVFFAIFALFFAQSAWRLRAAWRSGPEHDLFAIYLICAALFVYFSVSAFVSSRRSPQ